MEKHCSFKIVWQELELQQKKEAKEFRFLCQKLSNDGFCVEKLESSLFPLVRFALSVQWAIHLFINSSLTFFYRRVKLYQCVGGVPIHLTLEWMNVVCISVQYISSWKRGDKLWKTGASILLYIITVFRNLPKMSHQ